MPITVTFDSNVWRKVASPYRFPQSDGIEDFLELRSKCAGGEIKGMLSETIFDLEAIKGDSRRIYLGRYNPHVEITDNIITGRSISSRVAISPNPPNPDSDPRGMNQNMTHLSDAFGIGFKLLRCSRVGMPKWPDSQPSMYLSPANNELTDIISKLHEAYDFISELGAGIEQARKLGNRYRSGKHQTWLEALSCVPENQNNLIRKTIAEWADGDAVATHIAHKIEYFCTLDEAKRAGNESIFSAKNRNAVSDRFGVKFVTPRELCKVAGR